MGDLSGLLAVMTEIRRLLALPENDFAWSSWRDQRAALADIDQYISDFKKGAMPHLSCLFAPTGPLQEASLRSGWGAEFIALAERFDSEMANPT
jgi:hypothetical protein